MKTELEKFLQPENQHPAVSLFPDLSEDDLKELTTDIKKNGLRESILVGCFNGNWLLIDGKNRLKACKAAGIVPDFQYVTRDISEEETVGLAVSKNLARRHLTPAMRGAIALQAEELLKRLLAEAKQRQK